MGKIKVLVADDHTILRQGIKSLLANEEEIEVIGEAKDGREALTIIEETLPDVILMDIAMPGIDGLSVCEHLKSSMSNPPPVLMITALEDEESVAKLMLNSGFLICSVC